MCPTVVGPAQYLTLTTTARAIFSCRRYDEAREGYTRALQLDPICEGAHTGLGAIHMMRQEWSEAIECFHDVRLFLLSRLALALKTKLNLSDMCRPCRCTLSPLRQPIFCTLPSTRPSISRDRSFQSRTYLQRCRATRLTPTDLIQL